MRHEGAIVVTGGAGFVGTNYVRALNAQGCTNLIIVDHLDDPRKERHLAQEKYAHYYDRDDFLANLSNFSDINTIIHLGACTNTGVTDETYLARYNTEYSSALYEYCAVHGVRFIYASSGATYGDGVQGFDPNEDELIPLNEYGKSKHAFDHYVRGNAKKPPQWAGLKFFNVYGPHEDHKDGMASMVYQGYQQIMQTGVLRLFKSSREGMANGGEQRDFVWAGDVVNVLLFFLNHKEICGFYNVGTGRARTFLELATILFRTLNLPSHIEWIDMPDHVRGAYQYFTEADIIGLKEAGFSDPFISLEEGIARYVQFLESQHQ